jgi:hypothetical protein
MKYNLNTDNSVTLHDIKENGCIETEIKDKPAVYIFVNTVEKSYYVGSTSVLLRRLSAHKCRIKN